MESSSAITDWIHSVRQSDEVAAAKLWDKYAPRLRNLARRWIQASGLYDEEDIVVSAYQTLFEKLKAGEFIDVNSRDAFWALLAIIAARKANDFLKRDRTQKRGRIQTIAMSAADELELASDEQRPEMHLLMAEECKGLLDQLADPDLKQVALLRLEGAENPEIARQMNLSQRSIQRMVKLIREIWEKRANE